jgi:glycopeptide antibiotics resistance protein
MATNRYRAPGILLAGLYGTFVGLIAFSPIPIDHFGRFILDVFTGWTSRHPKVAWLDFRVIEQLSNVVLFVPLAVLIATIAGIRWFWTAMPILFAVSVCIELIQGELLSERVSSPLDVVTNSLGALVGTSIGFVLLLRERLSSRTRQVFESQVVSNTNHLFSYFDDGP